MQSWADYEFAQLRCDELRAEAARQRLVRLVLRNDRISARRRIARALLAFGSFVADVGRRIDVARV